MFTKILDNGRLIHQPETKSQAFDLYRHVNSLEYYENNLSPEHKAKWVAALRSGEYKQGYGALCTINSSTGEKTYCCLGVDAEVCGIEKLDSRLQETIDRELVQFRYPLNDYHAETSHGAPGAHWSREQGFASHRGTFAFEFEMFGETWTQVLSLTSLNDDTQLTFSQIADIVEYFF